MTSFNPFQTPRSHIVQQQACMREWIRSGHEMWMHSQCGRHAHDDEEEDEVETSDAAASSQPTAAAAAATAAASSSSAAAADSSRRSHQAAPLRHTRTPYFYNLFPHLWSSQSQHEAQFECKKPRPSVIATELMQTATDSTATCNSAAAAAAATASTAMDESDEHAAAAASRQADPAATVSSSSAAAAAAASSSSVAAVSIAAPPAAAAPRRLTLRPRSPSHLFRLGLGSEHARRVRAQSFADDLVRLTPHISSSAPQTAAADSMPGGARQGLTPTSPTSPSADSSSSSSSSAPLSHPIRHGGHTRFSKPISDMGDYLGVMRLSYNLRHPLAPGMEPLDDPAYVQQILSNMQQQQQQRQAQAQAQQQANEAAAAARSAAAAAAAAASSPMELSSWESSGSLTPSPPLSSSPPPTLPAPPSQQPPAGLLPNPDRLGGNGLSSLQPLSPQQQSSSPRRFPSLPATHLAHPLHVDEADDDVLPPVVVDSAIGGAGLGLGGTAGSSTQLMMLGRRRRKDQRKGGLGGAGAPKMSWAAFLAARNGVAAAAAAAAAAAQSSPSSLNSGAGNTPPTSPVPDRKRTSGSNGGAALNFDALNSSAESAPPASSAATSPAKRNRAGDSGALSAPSSPASSSSAFAAASSSSHSAPVSPRPSAASSPSSSPIHVPSLLSNLLASMHAPIVHAPRTPTLAGPPPRSMMLRHRLESDTGAREFAATLGPSSSNSSSDTDCMVDAPSASAAHDDSATSASASVTSASLSTHVNGVISWFSGNLRDLRASSGGSVDAEYAALFESYRTELRAKVASAAPALLSQLEQSLQWKAVTDAITAASAASTGAAKAHAQNRDHHAAAVGSNQSMQQQAQRAVRA